MSTLDALRAVAGEQATATGAGFVGSEHLFLAWLMTAEGAAHATVTGAGITAESFRALLGKSGSSRRGAATGDGGISSHAQRAIAAAEEIARGDGRNEANADDVFLALIREPRGAIARALTEAKLKPSQLRAVARPVAGKPPSPPRREAAPRPAAPKSAPARARRDPETDDIPEPRPPERPRLTPPPKPAPRVRTRRWSWLWLLYAAIPVSVWLHYSGGSATTLFVTACLAIVPLASLMAEATEHLAERTGPMLGALLNATFGNATEVIVAIAALNAGYIELVKASITGSILGNLLLILGLSLFAGGLRQPILRFSRTAAGMSTALLSLAVAGLILPSLLRGTGAEQRVLELSWVVAAILAATYFSSLLFTLHTHRTVFASTRHPVHGSRPWPVMFGLLVLAVATAAVAVESEYLVDTIRPVTESLHVSQLFLGLIVIPIIGNAAEHATAIVAARKGHTELAVQIAVGSGAQVALLVAPILVLAGAIAGQAMNLVFPPFQMAALGIAVIVTAVVTLDGESHWLEGVQLVALYGMIAAAAWFI